MSWPTVIWAMVAAASLTMALPHLVIALRERSRVNFFFALAGFMVAWQAAAELTLMRSTTIAEAGRVIQISQIPVFLVVTAIMGFVTDYFGTARLWLGLLAVALRAVALTANFLFPPNLLYREITSLKYFPFLGETISMPQGPHSPWLIFSYLSSLVFLVFVIDAAVRLWRQGGPEARRRAFVVGGGIVFFIVGAQTTSILINAAKIDAPFFVSLSFMAIVAAMGFELTFDGVRAARLAHALQASEDRMSLAAESARLALWEWDADRDVLWMTADGRAVLGLPAGTPLDFAALVERVHPEDRASREAALRRAVETRSSCELEYRLVLPDGTLRWIAVRGRANVGHGAARLLLGVSMDITRQKQLDADTQRQRDELGHLARVAVVGEMATSLAHELNQPLIAISMNAGAVQRFLARSDFNVAALREMVADIEAESHRASEVIRGIKGMVRKTESGRAPVCLNAVVTTVLRLARGDALRHNCALATELEPDLPAVHGDAVQLQQVLLNLIVNAFDAMRPPATRESRRIEITSRRVGPETVEVAVRDFGPGLPADDPGRVFTRFYSTKPDGMGLGLAISRSIIEAHGGTLDAGNVAAAAGGGARFQFRLPAPVALAGEATA